MASLLLQYENLRRKEGEALRALNETLARVEGLPADQMEQARDALFHADHPFLIVLTGGFNSGKSSILNALIGAQALGVGATPTTERIIILRHGAAFQRLMTGETDTVFHPSPLLERVSLVDTPGLESVFKGHDEITRRFLHRADAVFLVLLATQAMSQANAEYLRGLRAYGKRVIILINQIDLLDEADRAPLREFVANEARSEALEPQIWMVSAKLAAQAGEHEPRDAALWEASGFGQIERFILQELDDRERVRGKLETPLQIGRAALANAAALVNTDQQALSGYRKAADNVRATIDHGVAAQHILVDSAVKEAEATFAQVSERGQAAIREVFQISRGARLAVGGLVELTGLGILRRRFGAATPAKAAFDSKKVFEPLDRLMPLVDTLSARLEANDIKDTEDAVDYARKEADALPDAMRGKLIGKLQPPVSYRRALDAQTRSPFAAAITGANVVEFERIDRAVQGVVVLLAVYELVIVILAIAAGSGIGVGPDGGSWVLFVLGTLALMAAGLGFVPLRGWLLARAFADRMAAAQDGFTTQLRKIGEDQLRYGEQLRRDAVAPFLSLVDIQTKQADTLKVEVERHAQALTLLERELAALGT